MEIRRTPISDCCPRNHHTDGDAIIQQYNYISRYLTPPSHELDGDVRAFVKEYYRMLCLSPDKVGEFYDDASVLCRYKNDGSKSVTTTLRGISHKISSLKYDEFVGITITSLDVGMDINSEVPVLVKGFLTRKDYTTQRIFHSFLLLQLAGDFLVLRDTSIYVDESLYVNFMRSTDGIKLSASEVDDIYFSVGVLQQLEKVDKFLRQLAEESVNGEVSLVKEEDPPPSHELNGDVRAFVKEYYRILCLSPDKVGEFYDDASVLCRYENDGSKSVTTTLRGISHKILSLKYDEFVGITITSLDVGMDINSEVPVLVKGFLTRKDYTTQRIFHSFLLLPLVGHFLVLRDTSIYVDESLYVNFMHSTDGIKLSASEVDDIYFSVRTLQQLEKADKFLRQLAEESANGEVSLVKEEDPPVAEVLDQVQDNPHVVVQSASKIEEIVSASTSLSSGNEFQEDRSKVPKTLESHGPVNKGRMQLYHAKVNERPKRMRAENKDISKSCDKKASTTSTNGKCQDAYQHSEQGRLEGKKAREADERASQVILTASMISNNTITIMEEEEPVAEVVDKVQDDSQVVAQSATKIEKVPKKFNASVLTDIPSAATSLLSGSEFQEEERSRVNPCGSKVPKESQSPANAALQHLDRAKVDEYLELRRTAKEHWNLSEYYKKEAITARRNRKWQEADGYSKQASLEAEKAREADVRASLFIFRARSKIFNNTIKIDLHDQSVKDAMWYLKLHLELCASLHSVQILKVITGQGIHSEGGQPKIKPAVTDFLDKEGIDYDYEEDNLGVLLIPFDGKKVFSFQ